MSLYVRYCCLLLKPIYVWDTKPHVDRHDMRNISILTIFENILLNIEAIRVFTSQSPYLIIINIFLLRQYVMF